MRDLAESTDGDWLTEPGASAELRRLAQALREMGAGVDAFGELVRNEGAVRTDLSRHDVERVRTALDDLHRTKDRLAEEIASAPSTELLELRSSQRSTVKRVLRELDLDQRVRRQLRMRARKKALGGPHRPPHQGTPPPPSAPTTRPRCSAPSRDRGGHIRRTAASSEQTRTSEPEARRPTRLSPGGTSGPP